MLFTYVAFSPSQMLKVQSFIYSSASLYYLFFVVRQNENNRQKEIRIVSFSFEQYQN